MPVIIEELKSATEKLVRGRSTNGRTSVLPVRNSLQEALDEAHQNTRAIIKIVARPSASENVGAAVQAARDSIRALDQRINALHSSVQSGTVTREFRGVTAKSRIRSNNKRMRREALCWGEG